MLEQAMTLQRVHTLTQQIISGKYCSPSFTFGLITGMIADIIVLIVRRDDVVLSMLLLPSEQLVILAVIGYDGIIIGVQLRLIDIHVICSPNCEASTMM